MAAAYPWTKNQRLPMTEHQSSPSHPAPSQPSPWTHRPVTWAVAALLIGVSLGGGSLWWTRANSLPVVVTETARLGPVTRVLAVNGKIAAQDQVQIKPTVGGTVLDVVVREGDVVKLVTPVGVQEVEVVEVRYPAPTEEKA